VCGVRKQNLSDDMTRKRIYIFASVSLLAVTAGCFHAQQVWPVHNRDVVGVYRNARNSKDAIYLKANGDYEHDTGQQKYVGKWSISKWDGDVSLVSIQFAENQSRTRHTSWAAVWASRKS
jgi:isopentenyl diphosphate isomerase/L-lactate dehydrogenase-like FMN-dependent dehydrogenase